MKRRYDPEDLVTMYFIITKDDRGNKRIQAWTDDKEYALCYLEFHKCKNFKMTKHVAPFNDIINLINENNNDEIGLYNISTRNRDPKRKKGNETTLMAIPMTETEKIFVAEECRTLLATRIEYSMINDSIDFLKDKYRKALEKMMVKEVLKKVIHSHKSIVDNFHVDELLILYYSFPENFGM